MIFGVGAVVLALWSVVAAVRQILEARRSAGSPEAAGKVAAAVALIFFGLVMVVGTNWRLMGFHGRAADVTGRVIVACLAACACLFMTAAKRQAKAARADRPVTRPTRGVHVSDVSEVTGGAETLDSSGH
jgi:hypothetical protein